MLFTFLIIILLSGVTYVAFMRNETQIPVSSQGLILYDHSYIDGFACSGNVIFSKSKVKSAIECSNIFALQEGAAGASFSAGVCNCYSDMDPVFESPNSVLIVPNAQEDAAIKQWKVSENACPKGRYFCSEVLANSNYAQAICQSTKGCGGYTLESAGESGLKGCLLLDGATPGRSLNVTARYNAASLPTDNYRYGLSVSGYAPFITVSDRTTAADCYSTYLSSISEYPLAAFSASAGCRLYTNPAPLFVLDTQSTIFHDGDERLANTWNELSNTSLAGPVPGMADETVSKDRAMVNCINNPACVGFVTGTDGKVSYRSTRDPIASANSTATVSSA